ncbi:MAG TPA: serine/threonine-protein kinase, partial [Polyangiales bacterium]|nr:serine/threonine-protein kinase [Polyangiales bacterium]
MDPTRRDGGGRSAYAGSTTQRVSTLARRDARDCADVSTTLLAEPEAVPALNVGSPLLGGRLQVRGLLGEGGMGVVYEAFDVERAELVAVKTLAFIDPTEIYRLKNEFRAIADVLHRNLVRLHELFVDSGHWYFSMELVEGRRFDRYVRLDGQLDEQRLRACLPQLRDGVLAVHAAGKLHRDLKPNNVLVTDGGRVVVLDFGLVVEPELGGAGHTLDERRIAGTPAYMAPEQAAAEIEGPACDFYALGVMLFEALTGRLPFPGHGLDVLVTKQQHDPPRVHDVAPDAPDDLAELCDALLVRAPGLRPDAQALSVRLGSAPAPTIPPRASFVSTTHVPLVGREREREALRAAYAAARDGDKPVVVLLSGESGIGKSALVDGFLTELASERSALVLSGRCYEREAVPYKGFDAVIDALSRFLRRSDEGELARILPADVWALRRLFPVLARVDAVADAPERAVPDVQELRQRAFQALGELFARIRTLHTLTIHIDDL